MTEVLPTRDRIVDVAARLLQERGPAAVTTRAVADGAGVQAPTLYRLFGDKDGLLDAVAERVMATFVAAKADAVDAAGDLDPVEDLRRGFDTYVDFGLANPMLFVLLTDPARAHASAAARSGLDVLARRVHRIAAAGRLRVSQARAVDLVHAAGTGAVLTLLATPADRRDRALAATLRDAVLERVVTDPPVRDDDVLGAALTTLRARLPELTALSAAERRLFAEWLDRAEAG